LPVKAIAAIIQHNTSGFASPAEKNIKTPKDFEGKKYGGWGAPSEEAMIKGLMMKAGGDFSKVQMINIGAADFFTSVQKDVDFSWIYYGWDGVAAGIRNFPINFIKLQDIDPNLDFYTPVIVASEDTLKNKPDLVKKFLKATAKGYKFAIEKPEEAADILVKNAPETDKAIAVASQKYLAEEYMRGTENWGEMKLEMWENYSKWMFDNKLLEKQLDAKEAFTNEFLPK
jgi:ABC-type nitrate/sulfonate/bicarbonate transport system substrate-binding protein